MPMIQVFTSAEIQSFRTGGIMLRECLDMLAALVEPGITTKELDQKAEEFIRVRGGEPAFKGYGGYPATLCTSVDEECVHGIPGERTLRDGEIISLDCGVRFQGLVTDACITTKVGSVSFQAENLMSVTKAALDRAVETLRAGIRVGDLSAAIQEVIEEGGCVPVKPLTGHGVGRSVHQYPDIPNHGKRGTGPVFPAGTVVAVEPIVSVSAKDVRIMPDGWTLVTEDGSLSAHFEHTLLVTEEGCEVIA